MNPTPAPLPIGNCQNSGDVLALIRNDNLRALISSIVADQRSGPEDDRPDWAIAAAREFWRTALDMPKTREAKSEAYRFGYLFALADRATPSLFGTETAVAAWLSSSDLMSQIHAAIRTDPPPVAAEFYAGFSAGLKRGLAISVGPWLIHIILAVAWREVAGFRNLAQLHSWLDQHLGSSLTGTRDRIAKLCQKIHLKFPDKGGRPAKPRKAPVN